MFIVVLFSAYAGESNYEIFHPFRFVRIPAISLSSREKSVVHHPDSNPQKESFARVKKRDKAAAVFSSVTRNRRGIVSANLKGKRNFS